MTREKRKKGASGDIWIYVRHREGIIEEETFGLINEARRIISDSRGKGAVTAVALGSGLDRELKRLGAYGADRVLYVDSDALGRFHGELFAKVLFHMVEKNRPSYILMAQGPDTADLCSRLAALMETALVTRAVDFKIHKGGECLVIRPAANGYLFEKIRIKSPGTPIICFLPSVLGFEEPDGARKAEMKMESPDIRSLDLKTKVVELVEATPEDLDIEEADIVVSGGRGVGKDESFNIIHELARTIGGTVGGTRPVIDWQTLPFDRQIGQTGKTVAPRLIFACGISGANEFTAGMERSRLVIAINSDPGARIFRFADLGVTADVHEVVPLLIEGLKKKRET
jgi:electron transfer flavoprotein alpha subunit